MQVIEKEAFIAIRGGNEKEFERLFRSFYPRLCAYSRTMLPDPVDAEEIVQTLFCRLWEQREVLEVTTSVQAYLFRAVRNASFNHIKKMQIRDAYKTTNLENINSHPDYQPDHATHDDLRRRIENAIADLPEQCRLIFKMSRFEELKYKEIADELGLSIKTVENQMGKALKIMRLKLADFLVWLLLFFLSGTAVNAQVNQESALYKTLFSKDSLLFNIGFNTCDIRQTENLVSEKFEFYHDKGGITASKTAFIESIKNGLCKMDYKARRDLVASSLEVYPLEKNGVLYGALQMGRHQFYAIEKDKPIYLTSTAKFTHVWLLENGDWKLSRGLSYDHLTPAETQKK